MEKARIFGKKEWVTIPNILCYIRIGLIPVFMGLYLRGYFVDSKMLMWLGLASTLLATVTDLFDGKIARKYNQITNLGKLLDPLADKLMQSAIAVCICISFSHSTNTNYIWVLLAFVVFKEVTQILMLLFAAKRGRLIVNGANIYGKVATFYFDVVMLFILVLPVFIGTSQWERGWVIGTSVAAGVALLLLLLAYIMYIIDIVVLFKTVENNVPDESYEAWRLKFDPSAPSLEERNRRRDEKKEEAKDD